MSDLFSLPSSGLPTPEDVAGHTFPVGRRGFDTEAVRRFLGEVAAALREGHRRESELAARLADAERRAASPELDEETLSSAVGAETAKVLRTAHEAGREVLARAEARAAELTSQASAVLGERTREAEAEARIIGQRAQTEAESLLDSTKAECRTMVEEARDARRRILADLAERRRGLHVQLEQLRAGKDALAEVVEATARSVDDVRARLVGSEVAARVAADRAAQLVQYEHDDVSLESLVAESLALFGPSVPETGEVAAGPGPEEDGAITVEADGAAAAETDGAAAETETETGTETEPPLETSSEDVLAAAAAAAAGRPSVGDLFARIRAARAEEGSGDAEGEAAAPASSEAVTPAGGVDEVGGTNGADEVDGAEPHPDDAEKAALARRDELVAPVLTELARILKRELRSDQNELLDSLRHLQRGAEAVDLVPGEATVARLAAATTPPLVAAMRAGVAYGSGDRAVEPSAEEPGSESVRAAQELAADVVASLRTRLEEALSSVEEEGASAEAVGAAYRQWRGDRVEDLAAHFVTRTFSVGVLAGVGDGVLVQWVVDDGSDHCPDCDDNAVAGPQQAGDAFPTGQLHPPVHPGCRCTLVPVGS